MVALCYSRGTVFRKDTMKHRRSLNTAANHRWRVLILVICFVVGFTLDASADRPKYIIIMIGDGMGFEHVKAGGMFANGAAGTLCFEAFPNQGQITTANAGGGVTDSAAAGTAIATGIKVNNGVVSVALPGDSSELRTLLEDARDDNKYTGLVTTSRLSDATPAAFGAHEDSRNNWAQIAADYFGQTRPNLLLGGGEFGLTPVDAVTAGYTVVTNDAGDIYPYLADLNTEAESLVSGQFGSGDMPYEADGLGDFPSLSEMTQTALAILDNDPDGFFLMVEGALIDNASHSNIIKFVDEVVEFDNTVQVVLNWAQANAPDDTLIIVIADHETGGLTVTGHSGNPGDYPAVNWASGGHTGANVPIYAWGKNAELVFGVMDNTEIVDVVGDDTMEIETSTASVNVAEGSTATFSVRLTAQPDEDTTVTVARASGDSDITVTGGASLTFNAGNWSSYKTVTLTAFEDADAANGTAAIRCTSAGLSDVDVTATEQDNDTLEIETSTTSVNVPEGNIATFNVRLTAEPGGDVAVSVARVSGDSDITVTGGASLFFDAENWNIDQTVTLTAADDADALNGTATIRCSSAGLSDTDVTATEQDSGPVPPPPGGGGGCFLSTTAALE